MRMGRSWDRDSISWRWGIDICMIVLYHESCVYLNIHEDVFYDHLTVIVICC